MQEKLTWDKVYKEFKARFPNLRKEVVYWHPRDYMTIKVYLEDGRTLSYNHSTNTICILDEYWKQHR